MNNPAVDPASTPEMDEEPDPGGLFTEIYRRSLWWGGGESKSGVGSSLEWTQQIRSVLPGVIRHLDIRSMVDLSCGDWNWMKEIKNDLCDYTGIDVVKEAIDANGQKFADEKTRFLYQGAFDFLRASPDKFYDLGLCRHTFEHLPTPYTCKVLKEVKRVCHYALLTSSLQRMENTDLPMQQLYRKVDLESDPYMDILGQPLVKLFDGLPDVLLGGSYLNLYQFGPGRA